MLYVLFYLPALQALVEGPTAATAPVPAYAAFARDVAHSLDVPALRRPARDDPPPTSGRSASRCAGDSSSPSRRSSAVRRRPRDCALPCGKSIFTHDARRYRRGLHARLHDLTTLITGPAGTGKELVAQAIGRSRDVPFDPVRRAFIGDFTASVIPLHLAARPATLVESELFGHRQGAFTGAVRDRAGWLEICPALGPVLLDETGALAPSLQVKLLRVLQARPFPRIGDTPTQHFRGKRIAATHRDLGAEMDAGRFRDDLFDRLGGDVIGGWAWEEPPGTARAPLYPRKPVTR